MPHDQDDRAATRCVASDTNGSGSELEGTAERPRLSVFRILEVHLCPGDRRRHRPHPGRGLEPRVGHRRQDGSKVDAARAVGKALAERAKAAGVTTVVLDRGGYQYHGRVRSLAEGAREGGLDL